MDGPIPEAKLQEFRKQAGKASRAGPAPAALEAGILPVAPAAAAAPTVAARAGAGSGGGSGRAAAARARAAPQDAVDSASAAAASESRQPGPLLDAPQAATASSVPPLQVGTASGGDAASTAGRFNARAGARSGGVRTCTRFVHVCLEDSRLGCQACSKTCHRDNTSDLCEFQGRERVEPLPPGGGPCHM